MHSSFWNSSYILKIEYFCICLHSFVFFLLMNIQSNESTVRNTGKIANFKLAEEDIAMLQECDHGSHLGMKEEWFLARKLKNRQNFWF